MRITTKTSDCNYTIEYRKEEDRNITIYRTPIFNFYTFKCSNKENNKSIMVFVQWKTAEVIPVELTRKEASRVLRSYFKNSEKRKAAKENN